MIWLFNNWQGVNHAKAYSDPSAFYDLYPSEPQGKRALEVKRGDLCLVISQERGKVRVDYYTFERLVTTPEVHVMHGEHLRTEVLEKGFATGHPMYQHFFSINGGVKRVNVMTID